MIWVDRSRRRAGVVVVVVREVSSTGREKLMSGLCSLAGRMGGSGECSLSEHRW